MKKPVNSAKLRGLVAARESRAAARSGHTKEEPVITPEVNDGKSSVGPRWGKYHARACTDEEGTLYHSMLEREALKEIKVLQTQGYLANLKTQNEAAYNFGSVTLPHGKLKRKYLPDAVFDCIKAFSLASINGPVNFEAGKYYVIDIKSPLL